MGTISKTYSIDEEIYTKFDEICKMKKIKKSEVLQDAITDFIIENYDINKNVKYRLINNDDSITIHIKERNGEFLELSNGNKINVFDFEQIYHPVDCDVEQVLEHLTQNNLNTKIDMTPVEDDFLEKPFFDPKIAEDLINQTGFFKEPKKEYKIDDSIVDIRTKYMKDDKSAFVEVEEKTIEEKKQILLEQWRIENAGNKMVSGSTSINTLNYTYNINKRISDIKDRISKMSDDSFKDIVEKKSHMHSFLELLLSDMVEYFYLEIVYDDIKDKYIVNLTSELVCDDVKNIIEKLYDIEVSLRPMDVKINIQS